MYTLKEHKDSKVEDKIHVNVNAEDKVRSVDKFSHSNI
jgi:hypothetical protein